MNIIFIYYSNKGLLVIKRDFCGNFHFVLSEACVRKLDLVDAPVIEPAVMPNALRSRLQGNFRSPVDFANVGIRIPTNISSSENSRNKTPE